jgi:hypothetical protein
VLCNRYYWRDRIKIKEVDGACSTHERNVPKILAGKPDGKKLLGRRRHRCKKDMNIKVDFNTSAVKM